MATPPFLPDETKPADSDIVSQYPAVERAFRDIVETWLLVDHDTAGEHAQVTLPERGSDPTPVTDVGFLYTKNDGGDTELYYADAASNVVQVTLGGAINVFPANTSMLFYQSAAPTGWTKDIASTLGNHAIRLMTDVAWSGGSKGNTVFDTVFGAGKSSTGYELLAADVPNHTHADTLSVASGGAHTHDIQLFTSASGGRGFSGASASNQTVSNAALSAGAHGHTISGSVTATSGGGGTHAHGLSLDLNYVNVIRATKD